MTSLFENSLNFIRSLTIHSNEVNYQNVANYVLHQTQSNQNSRNWIWEIISWSMTSFMTHLKLFILKTLIALAISAIWGPAGIKLKMVKFRRFFSGIYPPVTGVLYFVNLLCHSERHIFETKIVEVL